MQLATSLNLKVRQTGLYRVTYEMLQAAGLDLAGVPINKITLTNRGGMVPLYVGGADQFGPGAFIEFYGQALDTLYTDTNIYTVQVSSSPAFRVQGNNAAAGKGLVAPGSYIETLVVNNQKAYATSAPQDDPWYDTAMAAYSTSLSWDFTFLVDGLADPAAPASLELVVWGISEMPQDPDHHLVVSLNGAAVANATFDGLLEKTLKVTLPAGSLHEGTNTLQLTLPGDTGAEYDIVYLDKYSITYPRLFQARDGRLTFTDAGKSFEVINLPSEEVEVYRLDDKGLARLDKVKVVEDGGSFAAIFTGTNRSATYLVSTLESLYAPALEPVRLTADLDQPAQYLIIAHPDFISGLAAVGGSPPGPGLDGQRGGCERPVCAIYLRHL